LRQRTLQDGFEEAVFSRWTGIVFAVDTGSWRRLIIDQPIEAG
jgi:hypothetical protein